MSLEKDDVEFDWEGATVDNNTDIDTDTILDNLFKEEVPYTAAAKSEFIRKMTDTNRQAASEEDMPLTVSSIYVEHDNGHVHVTLYINELTLSAAPDSDEYSTLVMRDAKENYRIGFAQT